MDLRQLFDDLVRFETDLWNGIDARLRQDCGVTLGGLNVLLVVERAGSCRVNDIAAALSITVGGASQAVDRLERAGHCTRRPHPADRRSSIVELTAEGGELVRESGPVFDSELTTRLSTPLPPTALGHLADALAVLRAATQRNPDDAPTPLTKEP
ncbi:MarR family winged helix-turn-helix transcriptional regulator [Streptomyces sp. NBC_01239]|uniref:MarR family winged helix-turn-helix transcriptional regulator n=1 Tax=Streptomyces sp. NBC_01239 TaxID=2903792 RepID=UPI0022516896|nr:MarR family winged helix-turn-helix transcriptional regulator [Streptomyces sp. NBC_01239]MCX4817453.1 MarR family winged helix-turn-helix transcriptional regulator [Streptomyces sp. NBC_01239]